MITDHHHEMASLYALGALTPEEKSAFEAELRASRELAELVAEYEAAATLLAEDLPTPEMPRALRRNILAAVRTENIPVPSPASTAWIPWTLLAACVAIFAGILWFERFANLERISSADQRITEMKAALAKNTVSLDDARKLIADLKRRNQLAEMQVATLTSKLDASYLASIAWDENAQEGILHVRRLPAPDREKAYQLWVIDPNQAAPISAGVFTVQADGSAIVRFSPTQKVSPDSKFAVSLEKSGGSASPEGPVVLSN